MQRLNTIYQNTKYHRPFIFNGLLWLFIFTILLFVFSKGKSPITLDYYYTLTLIVLLTIPVNFNFHILIPKLLKQERYTLYAICFLINVAVFALLGSWLFQLILDTIFPNYFFISYLSKTHIILVFVVVMIATTLLKLTEDWFYFNANQNKVLKQQNALINTQLSNLKSQINPHFLFNALNVIYALALEKKEGINDAIVQLSDILRYVIYDADTKGVTLDDEITLIKNFIAFQNHRTHNLVDTDLTINVTDLQFKIYPMLLLPLVENSFKHGVSNEDKNQQPIKIQMHQNNSSFTFYIENANFNTKNAIDKQHSGVGLENVKRHLNIVYPNAYNLNIVASENKFKVALNITNHDYKSN